MHDIQLNVHPILIGKIAGNLQFDCLACGTLRTGTGVIYAVATYPQDQALVFRCQECGACYTPDRVLSEVQDTLRFTDVRWERAGGPLTAADRAYLDDSLRIFAEGWRWKADLAPRAQRCRELLANQDRHEIGRLLAATPDPAPQPAEPLRDTRTQAACVVIIGPGGEILVSRRADSVTFPGTLQIPGGGVDEGETPEAAAVREIREETGLVLAPEALHCVGFWYHERHGGTPYTTYGYVYHWARDPAEDAEYLEPNKSGPWFSLSVWSLLAVPEKLIPGMAEVLVSTRNYLETWRTS